jgi:Flp pilus assembly protein CpaB
MDRRKLLLIFVAAWLSAGLLVWLLYSTTKTPKVESTVAIQAAARDMPAGTRLKKKI